MEPNSASMFQRLLQGFPRGVEAVLEAMMHSSNEDQLNSTAIYYYCHAHDLGITCMSTSLFFVSRVTAITLVLFTLIMFRSQSPDRLYPEHSMVNKGL